MPIKISVENNFLKVEGNDPERIYYERSRVSHELLPTYVQLRYDNNKLAQLDLTTLDSTNTAFSSLAAIVLFLTQVGDGDTGDGTAPAGGGGLTQTQAQAAFTAALQAQNQVEFQDILLEDANGVVYISTRQIDEETGTVVFTSRLPDGTAHTPVAPVTIPQSRPGTSDSIFFRVINGNGSTTSTGDYLTKEISRNAAGAIASTRWFNITTNTAITTNLPVQTDLKVWQRLVDDAVNQTANNTAFANSRIDITRDFWANVASTGVSVGDKLVRTTLTNGGTIWWNATTNASVAAPALANLVPTIDQCFIQGTITTTAHTLDLPMSASATFTDSAIIPIPTIDGKKANMLYMYRSAVPLASPLYPNDSGIIYGIQSGSLTRVPISNGSANRPNQANISNIGGFSRLNRELDGIVIRNWNLGTSTHVYRFSYQDANSDNPEIDNSIDAAYRLIVFQNNITSISEQINAQIDIKNITLQLYATGITAPTTFTVEQFIALAGANRVFPVQSVVLPIGASGVAQFQIPYLSRNGQFRISPTGTFTNYSYRLIFN